MLYYFSLYETRVVVEGLILSGYHSYFRHDQIVQSTIYFVCDKVRVYYFS